MGKTPEIKVFVIETSYMLLVAFSAVLLRELVILGVP